MIIQEVPIGQIKPDSRNSRTHSGKQIRQIANSIVAFGYTNPLLVDEDFVLIAGYGRYKAAELVGLAQVPVIVIAGLSPARRRALAIADNKIAANAGWDRERLAIEIPELADLLNAEGLDVSILGFEPVEIDQLQTDFEEHGTDPQDNIEPNWWRAVAVSKPGDLWALGNHKLLCGDARCAGDIARLTTGCRADLAFLDPPYNLRLGGVVGRGRTRHCEFAMASGEMSSPDYVRFLGLTLDAAASGFTRGRSSFCVCRLAALSRARGGGDANLWGGHQRRCLGEIQRWPRLLLQKPTRVHWRVSRRKDAASQQYRAGPAWAFALERLALRRSELVPRRPHGRASVASHRQAGRAHRRRHQGLHAAGRCCPRHLFGLGQHDHGW
jgi:hypothetical protein